MVLSTVFEPPKPDKEGWPPESVWDRTVGGQDSPPPLGLLVRCGRGTRRRRDPDAHRQCEERVLPGVEAGRLIFRIRPQKPVPIQSGPSQSRKGCRKRQKN